MNIIKLNAIDSTNSYLKKLAKDATVKSYTVVVARYQTQGRGQIGSFWISDSGKNLTFSTLIKFSDFKIEHQFYLSMAISLSILSTVKSYVKIPFSVKWPNDILAEKDKVAGILIENVLSGNYIKKSVIGIGLNVNQTEFPKSIGKATSLKNILGIDLGKDELLKDIITAFKQYVGYIENNEFFKLKKLYINSLYQYNKPTMFYGAEGTIFLGKIVDVSAEGKLVVELENGTTRKFSLKEIKFANR